MSRPVTSPVGTAFGERIDHRLSWLRPLAPFFCLYVSFGVTLGFLSGGAPLILRARGVELAEVGLLFGMYRTAYNALLKLFAFAIHACLVVAVLQVRGPVRERLRAPPDASGAQVVLDTVADLTAYLLGDTAT